MKQQRLIYPLIAAVTGCTSAGSTKQEPEPANKETASQAMFLRVTRLQDPTDTSIALDASGTLERIEGRQLVVTKAGTRSLPPADAAALIARAAALPVIAPPATPFEGDVYTLVDAGGRLITTVEPLASADLEAFVQAVLAEGAAVTLAGNTDFYVSAEPVQTDRAQRLQARGRTAVDPATMDPALASVVQAAVSAPYRLRRVTEVQFHALESALAGRDSFVSKDSTWQQINLWSPP